MQYYINSNKMFFIFILFFSTMISISSNSWLGCWIGLEINLLSFISIISKSNNLLLSEMCLKYFLIQSIASINFLFMIMLNMTMMKMFELNNFLSIMINSSLLMKMGSAPFHFWFPHISEGLSWMNCFILMTWQKITPMILLSYYYNLKFLFIVMILSLMIGSIGGLNQNSLRKLLTFSSINHLSWMIMSILISENLWMFYFMNYSFLIFLMSMLFYMLNSFFLNQLFFNNFKNMIKFNIFLNILSLGGLPPFLGFLPKWIIIDFLINNKFYFMSFLFIMFSLITLMYYVRITYSSFMFNYLKIKFFKMIIKNKLMIMLQTLSTISIMGLILSTLLFYLI
uniref:NADH-ubiquinone oxidoreductase chain 2 n=1 Tax=Dahlica ochrostigma TaxID=2093356 RepID=A0A6H1XJV5_9NEOP|nr:NADH dehydrogenase subunit 2 [Dahlica ochrostigma]QJA15898.1 NADH dehydrogenase subunit 2 [Dahlica ochrostigma]